MAAQVHQLLGIGRGKTTASSFPPSFLAELIRHGFLAPEEAFAIAELAVDRGVRPILMGCIAKYLSEPLLTAAATVVRQESLRFARVHAAANMMPALCSRRLNDLALELVRQTDAFGREGPALLYLALQRLSAGNEIGAIELLFEILSPPYLAQGIRALAPRLSPNGLATVARNLEGESQTIVHARAESLLHLVPWLDPGLRGRALSDARSHAAHLTEDAYVRLAEDAVEYQHESRDEIRCLLEDENIARTKKGQPLIPVRWSNAALRSLVSNIFGTDCPYADQLVTGLQEDWITLGPMRAAVASWALRTNPAQTRDYVIATAVCGDSGADAALESAMHLLEGGNREDYTGRAVVDFLRYLPFRRPLPFEESETERELRRSGVGCPSRAYQRLQSRFERRIARVAPRLLEMLRTKDPRTERPKPIGLGVAFLAPYLNTPEDLEAAQEICAALPSTLHWIDDLHQSNDCEAAMDGLARYLPSELLRRLYEFVLQKDPSADHRMHVAARMMARACTMNGSHYSRLKSWNSVLQSRTIVTLESLDAKQSLSLIEFFATLSVETLQEALCEVIERLNLSELSDAALSALIHTARNVPDAPIRAATIISLAGQLPPKIDLWPEALDMAESAGNKAAHCLRRAMLRSAHRVPERYFSRFAASLQQWDKGTKVLMAAKLHENLNATVEQRNTLWGDLLTGIDWHGDGARNDAHRVAAGIEILSRMGDREKLDAFLAKIPDDVRKSISEHLETRKRRPRGWPGTAEPISFSHKSTEPEAALRARVATALADPLAVDREQLFILAQDTRPDIVIRFLSERLNLEFSHRDRLGPIRELLNACAPTLDAQPLLDAFKLGGMLAAVAHHPSERDFYEPLVCRYAELHGISKAQELFSLLFEEQIIEVLKKRASYLDEPMLCGSLNLVLKFPPGTLASALSALAIPLSILRAEARYDAWMSILAVLRTCSLEHMVPVISAAEPLIEAIAGDDGLARVADELLQC